MDRLPVQRDLPLVIGCSAPEEQGVLLTRLERWRGPEVEWVDRLNVIVPVEQHGWLARGLQPIGVDDRMASCLDDLGVLESDHLVLLGQVAGSAPYVGGALGLAGDAGDPKKMSSSRKPCSRVSSRNCS